MRAVAGLVALVAMTAPVFAGEPTPVAPPLPQGPPSSVPPSPAPVPAPAPAPTDAPAPAPAPTDAPPADTPAAPAPKIDPAYSERPDAHESSKRMGPDERIGMRRGRDIVVRYHPDRSRDNVMMLALIGGAGVLFGGVGLYFHFDSRSASDEVKSFRYTGRTWTPEREDTYDRAHRSAAIAGVSYGIGGALLIATAVVYMITEPGLETLVIHPHENPRPSSATMLAPLPGGAFVSRGWEF